MNISIISEEKCKEALSYITSHLDLESDSTIAQNNEEEY
jgi:hypothetical protein